MKINKEEPTVIEGKPYFGLWFTKTIILSPEICENPNYPGKDIFNNPDFKEIIEKIKSTNLPRDVEIRRDSIIYREPVFYHGMIRYGTLAYKFLAWGRAFKVMNMYKKSSERSRRCKKVWINGRRKRRLQNISLNI